MLNTITGFLLYWFYWTDQIVKIKIKKKLCAPRCDSAESLKLHSEWEHRGCCNFIPILNLFCYCNFSWNIYPHLLLSIFLWKYGHKLFHQLLRDVIIPKFLKIESVTLNLFIFKSWLFLHASLTFCQYLQIIWPYL